MHQFMISDGPQGEGDSWKTAVQLSGCPAWRSFATL
jgi:hypothetical protein